MSPNRTIEVYCDDPGHGGEVVPIGTFCRDSDSGTWAVDVSRTPQVAVFDSDSRDAYRWDFKCGCGTSLPLKDSTLQWLLDLVWRKRAELESIGRVETDATRDVSRVALRTLVVLASKRTR